MKFSFNFYSNTRNRGFTIIELLVAVGVTALMVSLMLTIVVNVLGGWNRSSGSLTSGNQARQVLDRISQDIQSAILRRDGNTWMAVDIQTSKLNPDWEGTGQNSIVQVSNIDDSRFGTYGTWLRFISTVPDTNATIATISAPRAVGYQIVRKKVVAGADEISYQLFRSEVSPDLTFNSGYDMVAATYSTVTSSAGVTPGSIRSPTADQLIANNVVDFGVRFYKSERDPTTGLTNLRLIYPAAPANSPNPTNGKPAAPLTGALSTATSGIQISHFVKSGAVNPSDFYRNALPDYVDVMVRILTDEGVTQLSNLEQGLISGDWWDVVLANSRVFTRRVEIKSTSL
jgi:prepilin-type N-terminal cleavage/methylation domain-containing protein